MASPLAQNPSSYVETLRHLVNSPNLKTLRKVVTVLLPHNISHHSTTNGRLWKIIQVADEVVEYRHWLMQAALQLIANNKPGFERFLMKQLKKEEHLWFKKETLQLMRECWRNVFETAEVEAGRLLAGLGISDGLSQACIHSIYNKDELKIDHTNAVPLLQVIAHLRSWWLQGQYNLHTFKVLKNSGVNYFENPPENLTFKGGGPKAIAYAGALLELEKLGWLTNVRRVAGTSAGSIAALLFALGYTPTQIYDFLSKDELFKSFSSDPVSNLSLENIKEFTKAVEEKDFFKIREVLFPINAEQIISWVPAAAGLTTGGVALPLGVAGSVYLNPRTQDGIKILSEGGLCDGEGLRNWLKERIREKTGNENCTFAQLQELNLKNPKKYSELYVFAVSLEDYKLFTFSHEEAPFKDVPIYQAVYASSAFPAAFLPQLITTDKGEKLGYCMDGGPIFNNPVEFFDHPRFLNKGETFNNKTLALSLCAPNKFDKEDILNTLKEESITQPNLLKVLWGLKEAWDNAHEINIDLKRHNRNRMIELSNQNVGLLDIPPAQSIKQALIVGGKEMTLAFKINMQLRNIKDEIINFGLNWASIKKTISGLIDIEHQMISLKGLSQPETKKYLINRNIYKKIDDLYNKLTQFTKIRKLFNPSLDCPSWDSELIQSAGKGYLKIVKLLFSYQQLELEHLRFSNALNETQYRIKKNRIHALCYAVEQGKVSIVNFLLESGVDVNAVCRLYGSMVKKPAIHYAINSGQIDIVRLMLNRGAKIKFKKAFQLAIFKKNFKMVEVLIKNDLDVNIVKAYKLAISNEDIELIDYLKLTFNVKTLWCILRNVSIEVNFEVVQHLLKNYLTPENRREAYISLLSSAVESGNGRIVEYLLREYRGGNLIESPHLLNFLDRGGEMIKKFNGNLIKDADLEINLLKKAIKGYKKYRNSSLDVIQLLIKNGVDVNRNWKGGTALDVALKEGGSKIVKLLLTKGARTQKSLTYNQPVVVEKVLGATPNKDIGDTAHFYIQKARTYSEVSSQYISHLKRLPVEEIQDRTNQIKTSASSLAIGAMVVLDEPGLAIETFLQTAFVKVRGRRRNPKSDIDLECERL